MTHFISTVLVFQLVFVVVVCLFVFFCLALCLTNFKMPAIQCLMFVQTQSFFFAVKQIGKRAFLYQPQTSIDVTKLLNIFTPIM